MYQRQFPKIIRMDKRQNWKQTQFKNVSCFEGDDEQVYCGHNLYIKDPIGKIYYADDSEKHLYRENIAVSAFEYQRVKSEFRHSIQ